MVFERTISTRAPRVRVYAHAHVSVCAGVYNVTRLKTNSMAAVAAAGAAGKEKGRFSIERTRQLSSASSVV